MIILLDADGVLFNFVSPALEALHACGGPKLTHDQLDRYAIESLLETGEQRAEWWSRVTAPGFCAALAPYEGAAAAVSDLRGMGHDVVCVTSPMSTGATWAHERSVMLQKLFGFQRNHVISTSGKPWVYGHWLADDNANHCEDWQAKNSLRVAGARAVLIRRSYNDGAHTLADFVELVGSMS